MNCKNTLRREMIEKRKMLNLKNGDEFVERIRNLDCYKSAKTVMLYMDICGEADVKGLFGDNKTFLLPVTEGDDIYASLAGKTEKGAFNVPEPVKKVRFEKKNIDVVIVPGVAFDRKFNRMGFGKGYYDRFLEGMECVKIGVCHSFQMLDLIPSEPHDIKMDIIVTEREVWSNENT